MKAVLCLALISATLFTACGKDDKEKQQGKPVEQTKSGEQTVIGSQRDLMPAQNQRPIVGGYQVAEIFNVGENVYVRSILSEDSRKAIWVGTTVGVLEIDAVSRNMRNTYTRDHGLANEYVFGIWVDRDSAKWFGTNGGGITRLKDANWKTYFPMHGLADYWVYAFTEQTNGNLWIGTWAGLSVFNPKTEKFTNYLKELVNEWVYGLDVDSKDRVWIGTEGGVNRYDGKTWSVWTHKDGLGAPNTTNLPLSDNTGLGTRSRHDLSVIEQGMQTYNPNYIFSLKVVKDDSVWVGTWGGGASHYADGKWTNYTTADGLAGNIVYSVTQDSQGVLWFGTNGGLSKYDGNSWHTFTTKEGLLHNGIYAIAVTANNEVWVGSKTGVTLLTPAK